MIALHLSILSGRPFLWSEGEQIGALEELRVAVKAIGLKTRILKGNTDAHVTWLPSRGDVPLPSSPLVGPSPGKRRKNQLRAFPVLARPLQVEELIELTSISGVGNVPGSGVIFGNSVTWAGQLVKIALHLVAEEAFLPALVRRDNRWEARWIPVPNENTEQLLKGLIDGLPGICRCMNGSMERIPDIPRQIVADSLLAHCVDGLVRNANTPETEEKDHDSLHDAWLYALVSEDADLAWDDEREIREFTKQLSGWRRLIDLNVRSPFKFCFRLAEPPEDADKWRVDYLLQPKADQSLYLPVADLWKKGSKAVKLLRQFGGVPAEFALTALGQASGLCPEVAASMKRKHPWGFELDANSAFTFLQRYAPALQAAGFTALLPSWWVGRGPHKRLGLKVKAASPKMQGIGNGLTLDTMVQFDYTASLGGEPLPLEELETLAELKAPLVKVRGQWTQIDQDQIRDVIRFLRRQEDQSMSARDLLAMALGADQQAGGLPVDTVEVRGWLNDLLEGLTGCRKFDQLHQPEDFKGELRHYQVRGFSWLVFLRQWGLGACLADDMGLGKTVQALAFIQRERRAGEERPVLLICPTSVINNWRRESKRFTPNLRVMVHHGNDRLKKRAFLKEASKCAIAISSYAILQRDVDFLKEMKWAGVILDEAQNIKNPETKQSKAARALTSDYRIALTGTPIENHVGELWSLMDFLNPGLLGSQRRFKEAFYRPIQIYHDTRAAARLKGLTGPFILRRLKTDKSIISDLPEKIEVKEYCTLTKEQASLYQAVVNDMQEHIEETGGMNRQGLVLATLMKLKQVCNHPAQFTGDNSAIGRRSGKLQRLMDVLTEIREMGEGTLIFTQFAQMGQMLQSYLQEQFGEEVLFLYGGIPRKKRDEMIERFQKDQNAPQIFILSLRAGGTGLTLTRANHVIHYDRWWNPAVENQATDRAFRIGQEKNVQVRKFVVAGTLEERIDDMIESKIGVASQVVGTGERWLTELSNEELRNLIALGKEAVGE